MGAFDLLPDFTKGADADLATRFNYFASPVFLSILPISLDAELLTAVVVHEFYSTISFDNTFPIAQKILKMSKNNSPQLFLLMMQTGQPVPHKKPCAHFVLRSFV